MYEVVVSTNRFNEELAPQLKKTLSVELRLPILSDQHGFDADQSMVSRQTAKRPRTEAFGTPGRHEASGLMLPCAGGGAEHGAMGDAAMSLAMVLKMAPAMVVAMPAPQVFFCPMDFKCFWKWHWERLLFWLLFWE